MHTFIFTMAILLGIEALLGVICLGMQIKPERTFGAMALTTAVNTGLIIWACVLLYA
jgi:hypothetical protein